MITFKTRNGRLGEVINLMYGLFYFCIRNDIPLDYIVINANCVGKPFGSEECSYVIRENMPIFKNISRFIRTDIEDFQKFLQDNDFQEYKVGYGVHQEQTHIDLGTNYIICDYWHFPFNKKLFHALFRPPSLVRELKTKYPNVDFSTATSCHVRRGDFIYIQNNDDLKSKYKDKVPSTKEQVLERIDKMHQQTNGQVIIFSDDIEWCRQNIQDRDFVVFMDGNKPYEDIMLIGMCKYHIQFNSSYFNLVGIMLGD